MDEDLTWDDNALYLPLVAALIDLGLDLAGQAYLITVFLEYGADYPLTCGLAFSYVPFGIFYGKARALMHCGRTQNGVMGLRFVLCHFVFKINQPPLFQVLISYSTSVFN